MRPSNKFNTVRKVFISGEGKGGEHWLGEVGVEAGGGVDIMVPPEKSCSTLII